MTEEEKDPDRRQDAALELYARRRARARLIDFTSFCMPAYKPSAHHRLIAQQLEAVAHGSVKRIILTMPPRHGKSELASRHLPAWYLGKWPSKQIICATYNAEYAVEFGRDVRRIVQSDEYGALYPDVKLAEDSKAANRWQTKQGGSYLAAGIGTGITGRGAHLAIIDDPVKDRADADSKLFRDRAWDWYRSVFYTRLMPNASIVLILTRWHDDDLAGRLLQEANTGGEQWKILSMPALAQGNDLLERKEGEPLWPEWYPLETLENIRRTMGAREWSALFQQTPIQEEGAYFQKAWIEDNFYNREQVYRDFATGSMPLHIYGASDYAVTDSGGDYTVHLVVGVDSSDTIYVLDMWRGQTESAAWVEEAIDLMDRWKPLRWGEEAGQINKSIGPYLAKRMAERRVYCARETFSSAVDKATRARAIQARMSMGKVKWPQSAAWMDAWLYEATRFPAGTNDDIVDAISIIGRMLESMYGGPSYKEPVGEQLRKTTVGEVWEAHRKAKKRGRGTREAIVI